MASPISLEERKKLGFQERIYNLGNLWRRLTLPRPMEKYSLTSLQQRLVKTRGAAGETCALLLAALSRKTSEPAAIRRDAGADRGATGTMLLNVTSGMGRAGWDKEMCCKSEAEHGEICGVQMRVADGQGAARDANSFTLGEVAE